MKAIQSLTLPIVIVALFAGHSAARAAVKSHAPLVLSDIASVHVPKRITGRNGAAHRHERLRHILAQPPFQQWRLREKRIGTRAHNPLWHGLAKQWDRLLKWLGQYFHPHKHRALRQHHASAGFSFADFLKIMATVLGIALVAGIALVLLRWRAIGHAVDAPGDGLLSRDKINQALERGDALAMASDSWMRAARQFGSDGDFRAMYRAMYLSLLAGLHENGRIRFRRSFTNWHYVRDFHGDHSQRALFESLTDLFDHVWYGRKLYPHITPDILRQQIHTLVVQPDKQTAGNISGHAPARREDLHA